MPRFLVSFDRSFDFTVEAESEELLQEALVVIDPEDFDEGGWEQSVVETRASHKVKVNPEFGVVPKGQLGYVGGPALVEWIDYRDWVESQEAKLREQAGGPG